MRNAVVTMGAVLACLVLAGCAQGDTTPASTSAALDHGALDGIVVDSGVRPVGGAAVLVTGNGQHLVANTSAGGSFRVEGLPLGSYFVQAHKVGFLATQTTVAVEAANVPVRLTLNVDPSYRTPVVVPFKHKGTLSCGIVASAPPVTQYAAVAVCNQADSTTGLPLTQDTSRAIHTLDPGAPAFVQSELDWTSTQAAGSQLLLYDDAIVSGGTAYVELGSNAGPSPVVVALKEGRTGKLGLGSDLQIRVFPWFQAPLPVGATVSQGFEVVTDVFYGFSPPDGWLFSRDGLPPAPAG